MDAVDLEDAIINALAREGPLTTRELEAKLEFPEDDVGETCWNMAHSGLLDINWANNKFRLIEFKGGLR
jgi:hypothetical protein